MKLWRPWLAERYSLRPVDIGDLSPSQMIQCVRSAAAKGTTRGS